MPSVAQKYPIGGIWPLGVLTIAHGTPVALTHNVGAQAATAPINVPPTLGGGRPLTTRVRQLIFSAPTGNTGDVYVQYGNFSEPDTNATTLIVPKGQTLSLPQGAPLLEGYIDVTKWYVDGTTSDTMAVSAVV